MHIFLMHITVSMVEAMSGFVHSHVGPSQGTPLVLLRLSSASLGTFKAQDHSPRWTMPSEVRGQFSVCKRLEETSTWTGTQQLSQSRKPANDEVQS